MNEQLYHWGIKGMKWGQRRFQNKDGSLTPEGEKRYGQMHEDYKKAHNGKGVHEMSDTELRNRVNRLQMEQQYRTLTESKKTNKGKKAVQAIIATAGTIAGLEKAYKTYTTVGKKIVDAWKKKS